MNLKKFKLDCYNKIIEDYSNNHDFYMFFLYPLIFKLKKQDIKNYNYSIFLKLKKKQPLSFNEYNVIKKYTKKNLDKDIHSTIKCIFWSDYIDKNNIYAIYYLKKHLSTKKQTPINLINLLYRLLTNAPTKISGGMFDYTRKYLSNKAKDIGNKVISNVKNNLRILKEKVTNKNSDSPPPQSQDIDDSLLSEKKLKQTTQVSESQPQPEIKPLFEGKSYNFKTGDLFRKYNPEIKKYILATDVDKYQDIHKIIQYKKDFMSLYNSKTGGGIFKILGNKKLDIHTNIESIEFNAVKLTQYYLTVNDKYRRQYFYNLGNDYDNKIFKLNKYYITDLYYETFKLQIDSLKIYNFINFVDFYAFDIYLMLKLYFVSYDTEENNYNNTGFSNIHIFEKHIQYLSSSLINNYHIFEKNDMILNQIKNIYKLFVFNILQISCFNYKEDTNINYINKDIISLENRGYFQYLKNIFEEFKDVIINYQINIQQYIKPYNKFNNELHKLYPDYISNDLNYFDYIKDDKNLNFNINCIFYIYLLNYYVLLRFLPDLYNCFLCNKLIDDKDIIYGFLDYMIELVNIIDIKINETNNKILIDSIKILKDKLNIFKDQIKKDEFINYSFQDINVSIDMIIGRYRFKQNDKQKQKNDKQKQEEEKNNFYQTRLLIDLNENKERKEQFADLSKSELNHLLFYLSCYLFFIVKKININNKENNDILENIKLLIVLINGIEINEEYEKIKDDKGYENLKIYYNDIEKLDISTLKFYKEYYIESINTIYKYRQSQNDNKILKIEIQYKELLKNFEQNKPKSQYSIFLDILGELNEIMPIAYSMDSSEPHITDYNEKTKKWTKEHRDELLRNFDKDKLKFLFNYKDSSLSGSDKSRLDFFKQYYKDGYKSLIGLKMDISDLIIKEGGSSKIGNVKLQLLLNYIISHISSKK
jgi:hypothetical protein